MFKNKVDEKAYSHNYYLEHKEELKAKQKIWRETHKEQWNGYNKKWRKSNPDDVRERAKKYRTENRDKINKKRRENHFKYKEKQKEYRDNLKLKVFNHYCNGDIHCQCPNCPETNPKFLTLDHINGGGNQQRRELGSSTAIYKWIIDNNYPEGYQVLCANCNFGRQMYGVCPHEKEIK